MHVRTRVSSFSKPRSKNCSSSSPSSSTSSHTQILTNLGGLMNKYPPGLGFGQRRPSSPPKYSNSSTGNNKNTGRTSQHSQHPTVRLPHISRSSGLPQPQFRSSSVSPYYAAPDDPFSDDQSFDPTRTIIYDSQQDLQRPNAQAQVRAPPLPDRDARSKLVAGILLHRVHAVGKPIRTRPSDAPRAYVRSGLSRTVSVECC